MGYPPSPASGAQRSCCLSAVFFFCLRLSRTDAPSSNRTDSRDSPAGPVFPVISYNKPRISDISPVHLSIIIREILHLHTNQQSFEIPHINKYQRPGTGAFRQDSLHHFGWQLLHTGAGQQARASVYHQSGNF